MVACDSILTGCLCFQYWDYAPDPTMPEVSPQATRRRLRFTARFLTDCLRLQPDPAYQLRIFYVTDEQKSAAEESIAAQKKAAPGSLIDLYAAADYEFWKAEEYHQH